MPSESHSHFRSTPSQINWNTTLCLACSSSLPPLKILSPSASSSFGDNASSNGIYITKCCQRPICPSCIASNPRLARYDPCLACLGGVGAVDSKMTTPLTKSTFSNINTPRTPDRNFNLDGAVRDEDTFVLGDDDDDEPDEISPDDSLVDSNPPPPPYNLTISPENALSPLSTIQSPAKPQDPSFSEQTHEISVPINDSEGTPSTVSPFPSESLDDSVSRAGLAGPCKYYLKRSDTLMGICLRFGVDSHEICKLNNLPASIMRTTPHLLHTRAFLLLPATPKTSQYALAQSNDTEEEQRIKRREEILVRERAERRVQTLMKEVDWRVAKAYVALADDVDERDAHHSKLKEMGSTARLCRPAASGKSHAEGSSGTSSELEILAVERYLDDDEWEAEERRAGRRPEAMSFPLRKGLGNVTMSSGSSGDANEKGWWWQKNARRLNFM